MATRLVIAGVAGRMGMELLRAAENAPEVVVAGGTVRPHGPAIALSERLGLPVHESTGAALTGHVDAVIDFTSPEATRENAKICSERGVALIVGTTGLQQPDRDELARAAQKIPVVFAPNFSVGVNLLYGLAQQAARVLGDDYDVEIVEAHHREKKDAPSGTALRLAEVVAETLGRKLDEDAIYGRRGMIGSRPRGQIGIGTVRGGDVIGEHTLFFFGDGERLELTHRASSRQAFAQGAVRAATWAAGRAPGLYDMQDVLDLRGRSA